MYQSLADVVKDLEQSNQLIRIKEQVDPHLEMASITLRVFEAQGPALLFENVIGSSYPALSNLFGTLERGHYLFRDNWNEVNKIIALRNDPMAAIKKPFQHLKSAIAATKALPKKSSKSPVNFKEIQITDLPLIQHWPHDGGAFITLPQVYSEDPLHPGIMHSNLGMYRIQLTGNNYQLNKQIGLHYQIHRGIGVHQTHALKVGKPLKVSIFIGGAPANTLAAVMPLPEGMPELTFAGLLNGRRFKYHYNAEGYMIANDADFVITGEILPETMPEGPFGDHFGYYSVTHPFPALQVHKVYARENAIWPFTVVGRPPQEDTIFGALIHELTGDAIPQEIPGLKEVHAIDDAGVHPLLLALGTERYTPYEPNQSPKELLTLANRILGTGQLSLAKYLFIAADDGQKISTKQPDVFLNFVLERVDLKRDLHFQTKTTIDTLDYSGTGLNQGSKLVIAANGQKRRALLQNVPSILETMKHFTQLKMLRPGILILQTYPFVNYEKAAIEMEELGQILGLYQNIDAIPMVIVCDQSEFTGANMHNFLWDTFTKSNPAADIYGVNPTYYQKHWGCDAMIIDARTKPHHAPALLLDPSIEKKVDSLFINNPQLNKLTLR